MILLTKQIDYTLFFLVMVLLIFGLITISSVSVYPSYELTAGYVRRGLIDEPYNWYYLFEHIKNLTVACIALFIMSKVPYQLLERYARIIFLSSLFGLLLVLLIGDVYNGAKGWLSIPGLPSIQPMEFAKIGFILFSAYFFKVRSKVIRDLSEGFIPYMVYLGIVLGLLALQPDFGGILLFAPLAFCLYFIAGGRIRYLFTTLLVGFFAMISVYWIGANPDSKLYYINQRIDNYLADSKDLIQNATINYQTEQGLIAIGSGGFGGLGFGESIQKFGYLPEVQGDFIFSVIVEEWGLFGAMVIVGMYLAITYRLLRIASEVQDPFARYTVIGIACWIFLQTATNIGVNLNVIPLTGVTLPFISHGGSSLLALLTAIGITLNISRYRVLPSLDTSRRLYFGMYPQKLYDDRINTSRD
ncbi:FtsW/RodA/SpoVE family cell cycle protein [Candidatus Gracilibacteria bacterium]|nr:FtsW/RodA/SpoVE family cell cycle protein [Candidatus Gracilibacteria bacterium]